MSKTSTDTYVSEIVRELPLETEYKKPNGITPEDVKRLRDWLATQPHLPRNHISDLDLILAYHACDNSTEITKQLIDINFTSRTLLKNFFTDRRLNEKLERIMKVTLFYPLPQRTEEGYAVLYTHFLDSDPEKYVLEDTLKVLIMVIELWQYQEGTWPGVVIVTNVGGMRYGHIARYDLSSIQQFALYLQNASFLKPKKVYAIDCPAFWDIIFSLTTPFINKEILDQFKMYRAGSTELEKEFPIELLPKEAGGKGKSIHTCKEEMIAFLKAGQEYFDKEQYKRVDESLRSGKPDTELDYFGSVPGSFKQIEID